VHTVRDGVEAVDFVHQVEKPLHLVLLDLKLPRMNGLEVLRHIRETMKTQTAPVVILSSSNERVDVAEAYRLGANSFVQKPIEFNEFLETVRLLGTYWVTKNLQPD